MHCFSLVDHLDACLERGHWISFAGNVTYPSAGDLRAAAQRVPEARLLVETDAPYLAAQPIRGQANEPAHVVHTARTLAEVRGVTYEQLEATVERNAAEVFGW
jgi:TatD DNase family protein